MSIPDPTLVDSTVFRAGQASMQRRIGELLRQRRQLIHQLPAHHSGTLALASELDLIIRAVDGLPINGHA